MTDRLHAVRANLPGRPNLSDAVEELIRTYDPAWVYLFGSVPRGDSGADSDYDLLLVVPEDAEPWRRRSRRAYELLWGTGLAVDVLVCTRRWFEDRRDLKASLPGTVLREGRQLYAI